VSANPLTIIAALGSGAIAVAIAVNVIQWESEIEKNPVSNITKPNPSASQNEVSQSKIVKSDIKTKTQLLPAFDVVRIGPSGDSVIAGRASPNSTVIIRDNGDSIGKIIADERGEWVFLPKSPLPSGTRKLSLEMISESGDRISSDEVVLLVVPEEGKDISGLAAENSKALALKIPSHNGPSTLLQNPGSTRSKGVSIEKIDYDDAKSLIINGKADANALVNAYLGDDFIGQAKTTEQGIWQLIPEKIIKPGIYTLRADQVDENGKVLARVLMPFSRAEPITDMEQKQFVIVQPGNSLWRLAYKAYGKGLRYTTIFQANKNQIKDPDLIYPGQVFAMPTNN
jgi:hypothetical protein